MRTGARWAVVVGFAISAAIAVVVSRHTPAERVAGAAGQRVPAVVSATNLPVLGSLHSVRGATGWLNTPPLTDPSFRGSVVLVDFWTFGCINCQHTLSHLKAWNARYATDGLVVLGVHTPEFSYEAEPTNVGDYVRQNGISYPVALDSDHRIWNAWRNNAWPAFYLYDRSGRLRRQHIGEGGYDATEDAIRALLGVDPASARATV